MDQLLENKKLLLSKISKLESELETKKQKSHEYKTKLLLTAALEEDYLLEIEALKSNPRVIELKNTLKQLDEQISSRSHIDNNIEIQEKRESIKNLQKQIAELKMTNNTAKNRNVANKKQLEENALVVKQNAALKAETEMLQNNLIEIQGRIDNLRIENQDINKKITAKRTSTQEVSDALKSKQQQLQAIKTRIISVQEELATAKLELECSKCKPLNVEKRGNSLFGEVEDSRVKLEHQLKRLQKHYQSMERELKRNLQLKSILRKETFELAEGMNSIAVLKDDDEKINTYKLEIEKLQKKIENYKKILLEPVKLIGKNMSDVVIGYANSRIPSIWKELSISKDELQYSSKQVLETCLELQTSIKEELYQKLLVLQTKVKIEQFENAKVEYQLNNTSINLESCFDIPIARKEVNLIDVPPQNSAIYLDTPHKPPETIVHDLTEQSNVDNELQPKYSMDRNSPNLNIAKIPSNTQSPSGENLNVPQAIDLPTEINKDMEVCNLTDESHKYYELKSKISLESIFANLNICKAPNKIQNHGDDHNIIQWIEHSKLTTNQNIETLQAFEDDCSESAPAHPEQLGNHFTPVLHAKEICSSACNQAELTTSSQTVTMVDLNVLLNTERIGLKQIFSNPNIVQQNLHIESDEEVADDDSQYDENVENCVASAVATSNMVEEILNNSITTISSTTTENNVNLNESIAKYDRRSPKQISSNPNIVQPNSHVEFEEELADNVSQYDENAENSVVSTVATSNLVEEIGYIQDISMNSDIILEDNSITCITLDSSHSDSPEEVDDELNERFPFASFPHRDSFTIDFKWKETRKITSLTKPERSQDKENLLSARKIVSHPLTGSQRKPLCDRNLSAKRLKPASVEKRWRY